ncbi:unnamed protein product [Rotaria magnacalcarata]|uniref:Uncharacterized protein n=1 Tax=Rotaria magnacalcarata TaxID=392030 RepID=A0A8S2XW35_9BILA|nr:unnamed protein product [Rotaria magnacalcarata]CAF4522437.1 unnamed protein product [Rotaria magnacalcarata]
MYPHLQTSANNKPTQDSITAFEDFIRRYAINKTFATKLRGLRGYEIAFICDDSGSMKNPMDIALVEIKRQQLAVSFYRINL